MYLWTVRVSDTNAYTPESIFDLNEHNLIGELPDFTQHLLVDQYKNRYEAHPKLEHLFSQQLHSGDRIYTPTLEAISLSLRIPLIGFIGIESACILLKYRILVRMKHQVGVILLIKIILV